MTTILEEKRTLRCKKCSWRTPPNSTHPKQSLAMHISRAHGSLRGSPGATKRNTSKPTKKKPVHAGPEVNYCPHCGFNIAAVRVVASL